MIKKIKSVTSRLPSEYQEVKYIESTGLQYIDTGIVPNSTTRVVLSVAMTDLSFCNFNGWGSRSSAEAFFFGIDKNNTSFSATISANWSRTNFPTLADNKKHIFDVSNNAIMLDGVSYGTGNIGDTASEGETLYLFAFHTGYLNNDVYYVCGKERIYSCEIYSGDNLTRNFIPCYRKSDKTIGLYDLVNNTFYTNSGNGTFLVGGKIEEENSRPVLGSEKIIKKYVGEKVVYTEINYKDTQFTQSPFPTTWSYASNNTWFTQDTYGSWLILCDTTYNRYSYRRKSSF